MKIMLIRHFQTFGNLKKRYVGRTDEPLLITEEFPEAVEMKRDKLRLLGEPDYVVASPMKRCVQTARYLFPSKEPLLCPQMRECDFGCFEGKSYEELKDLLAYQEWADSWGKLPFPGGEGHEAFKNRCVEGFHKMTEQLIQKRCRLAAMVVHGGTIMAILSRFDRKGRDFYAWQVENGGGYLISFDELQWNQGQKLCEEIRRL